LVCEIELFGSVIFVKELLAVNELFEANKAKPVNSCVIVEIDVWSPDNPLFKFTTLLFKIDTPFCKLINVDPSGWPFTMSCEDILFVVLLILIYK